jgi:iron complex transport system ATP-binding protein
MSSVTVSHVGVDIGGKQILSGVSIEIDAGSWVGVVGPNGAGKSTFLRAVAGDLHYQGSIVIGGVERVAMDTKTRALALAYVPQRPVYPEGMAVFDYVLLGRTPYMGALAVEKPQDIAAVWDALRALSIAEFAERDVSSLSGGETQRVSLARVLSQGTAVLVLDEATASLDLAAQHEVLELIDELRIERSITVLSAIHDLTAAAQFCETALLLDTGKVVAQGPASSVFTEEILREVFEPTIRVIEIEGNQVVVSLRSEGNDDVN